MSNSHVDSLRRLLRGVKGLPPLTAIEGVLYQQCEDAESVIEHYEEWEDAGVEWMPENQSDEDLLLAFFHEVCRRAEEKMMITSKLEGSHYAAMREVVDEVLGK